MRLRPKLMCILALAACNTNRPVTQPLEVKKPLRVGFDTPTPLRALIAGDSVTLPDVTLLIGRPQSISNDTLFLAVSEYVGGDVPQVGAARASIAGATVIVPMSAVPRMYVRESPMDNKWLPFAAVVGVLGIFVGIVAILLNEHG